VSLKAPSQRVHVLLDASVVSAYFIPHSHRNARVHEVTTCLVEGVRKRAVGNVVLYVPNISIPEVFGTFAKYAYGIWNHQVKRPITRPRYQKIRHTFHTYLRAGAVLEQYDLTRNHILATDLIAPVDHRYQIRKKKGYRNVPMGAVDHMIIAMGIYLSRLHGRDNVAILTADRRMGDGVRRAERMKASTASQMKLPARAKDLGYEWDPSPFPQMLCLPAVSDDALAEFFGAWPLPTRSPRGVPPRADGHSVRLS
jgi:hypothetical protein